MHLRDKREGENGFLARFILELIILIKSDVLLTSTFPEHQLGLDVHKIYNFTCFSMSWLLATWCEEQTYWKRPWCWERLKTGGEGNDRRWNGWMASPTQWKWVRANSEGWWRTGKPGMLQSMGSQSQMCLSNRTIIQFNKGPSSTLARFVLYELLIKLCFSTWLVFLGCQPEHLCVIITFKHLMPQWIQVWGHLLQKSLSAFRSKKLWTHSPDSPLLNLQIPIWPWKTDSVTLTWETSGKAFSFII